MKVEIFVTEDLRNQKINDLDFSGRTKNGLKRLGVDTLGEIIDKWQVIVNTRGLGKTSIREIANTIVNESLEYLPDKQLRNFYYGLLINNSAEELRPVLTGFKQAEATF